MCTRPRVGGSVDSRHQPSGNQVVNRCGPGRKGRAVLVREGAAGRAGRRPSGVSMQPN